MLNNFRIRSFVVAFVFALVASMTVIAQQRTSMGDVEFVSIARSGEASLIKNRNGSITYEVNNGYKLGHEDNKVTTLSSEARIHKSAQYQFGASNDYYVYNNWRDTTAEDQFRVFFRNFDTRIVGTPLSVLVQMEGFYITDIQEGVRVYGVWSGREYKKHDIIPFADFRNPNRRETEIVEVVFVAQETPTMMDVDFFGARATSLAPYSDNVPDGVQMDPGSVTVTIHRIVNEPLISTFAQTDQTGTMWANRQASYWLGKTWVLDNMANRGVKVVVLGHNNNQPLPVNDYRVIDTLRSCNQYNCVASAPNAKLCFEFLLTQINVAQANPDVSKVMIGTRAQWSPFILHTSNNPIITPRLTLDVVYQFIITAYSANNHVDDRQMIRMLRYVQGM